MQNERMSDQVPWFDTEKVDQRWTKQGKVGSGGQAHGYKVCCHDRSGFFFAKILKSQTDTERRARMFREAAALATFNHASIPALVESNAHRFADHRFELYLVTEYVAGPTLAKFITSPLAMDRAIQITDKLAAAVQYLQDQNAVHRDIKPDNIIMRDGTDDPVLVDFGMTFNGGEPNHNTGDWQELGNRFLRLPELSAYSENKRDFRTDIAFLTGILYFCVTGRNPAILQDHERRFPHQIPGIVSLDPRLLAFFDRGFQPALADRFANIRAFRSELAMILRPENTDDAQAIAQQLKAKFPAHMIEQEKARAQVIKAGWTTVMKATEHASDMTDKVYQSTASGTYNPASDAPYRNIGLHHHYREHRMRYWLKITCRFVGSEFVISASEENGAEEEILLRTSTDTPSFELFEQDRLVTRLLRGVSTLQQV